MTPELAPARVKILAVDDIDANLIALQAALRDADYDLHCATSGPQALNLLQSHDFALILLDVQMPVMDGFELAKLIRKDPATREVPIIFLTAVHDDHSYVQRGYVEGAVDYLFKPLDLIVLRSKVAVFADLHRKSKLLERQAAREKEAALREQEYQLLKEALRARDEFLSVASHELKTPLTPLSLQLEHFKHLVLEGRLRTLPDEKLVKIAETAITQVNRLGTLINDLLDLSRIVEGQLKISPVEMELGSLVRKVVQEFEHAVKKAQCEVTVDLGPEIRGHWDPFRVEQIIINLFTNALKYAPRSPIHITTRKSGGQAHLTVKDSGIGIRPEDQKRIFTRFGRAVSAQNYGGLGLGLYISDQIAKMHGGSITVQSELGKGSIFTLSLPLL